MNPLVRYDCDPGELQRLHQAETSFDRPEHERPLSSSLHMEHLQFQDLRCKRCRLYSYNT